MSANSKIEWTTHTYNCWWGCIEDGPECDNCYARAFSKRTGHDVWGLGPRRFFGDAHWKEPLKWNAAAAALGVHHRVFCGSMMDIAERRSDAVGEQMDAERARLWSLIKATPNLDWLLLSKRPQNFSTVLPVETERLPNVWLGTTAGTREGWEKRVKYLRKLNPVVRFVSVEPQLEAIDGVDLHGIDWVIQGGESGPGAREFKPEWARSMRDQCSAANVAYFFKQWGGRLKKETGRELDGRTHDEFPTWRAAAE